MQVTFEIPDSLAAAFHADHAGLSRATLEAFALEGYRSNQLSEFDLKHLLGFDSRMQVHGFLKEHGVDLQYSLEDVEQDIRASDELLASRRKA
jgi:Uncharacterised protein family (UPF0175)